MCRSCPRQLPKANFPWRRPTARRLLRLSSQLWKSAFSWNHQFGDVYYMQSNKSLACDFTVEPCWQFPGNRAETKVIMHNVAPFAHCCWCEQNVWSYVPLLSFFSLRIRLHFAFTIDLYCLQSSLDLSIDLSILSVLFMQNYVRRGTLKCKFHCRTLFPRWSLCSEVTMAMIL